MAEARDRMGRRIGALCGYISWNWMYGAALWVNRRARGRDVGTRLLAVAEAAAYRRGVRNAYLETFAFQAPGFYRKIGNRVYGKLEGYPRGSRAFYLHKPLRRSTPAANPPGDFRARYRTGSPKSLKPTWRWVGKRLGPFISRWTGKAQAKELAVTARDEKGGLAAGLRGSTFLGGLQVEILWVREDLRGKGLGTRVLHLAEKEAKRRGCRGAALRAYGFQSPGFWRKQGYRVFGTLRGLPKGSNCRYFMKKWKV